ncbi:MAG TPA: S1 family peptidase [Kofleriaceae bacterium]|nr:S1 family peptidase [Kofleriaceae bacterium]
MRLHALIVTLAVGCSSAPELATGTQAIRAGTPAPDDNAVVAIGPAPVGCTEQLDARCTGTLIAPNAVLTAAHCARIARRIAVFVGADVARTGELHDVALSIVHPSYQEGVATDDIAVLVLATAPSIAPLPLATTQTAGSDIGRTVRAVGYGGTDETGNDIGVRRQGTSGIAAVNGATFRTTPMPSITCSGDSGGPVLIDRGSGEEIAGVTSQGDLRCETYTDNVDVVAHRAFIADAVATAMAWTPNGGAAASCKPGCVTDDDCALGLECDFLRATDTTGVCALAPLEPGTLDGDCMRDDQCSSGTCARAPGEQACRCHVPCNTDDGGCNAQRRTPGLAAFVLLVLLAIRARRR